MSGGLASMSNQRHPQHVGPSGGRGIAAAAQQSSNAPHTIVQPAAPRRVYMQNMQQQNTASMMSSNGVPMPPAIGSQFKPAPGGSTRGDSSNIWSNFGGQMAPAGSAFASQAAQRQQQPRGQMLAQRHSASRHQPRAAPAHLLQQPAAQHQGRFPQDQQQRHKQQQGHGGRHRGHGHSQQAHHDGAETGPATASSKGRRHNSGRGRGRTGGRGRGHAKAGDKGKHQNKDKHQNGRQTRFKTRRNPSSKPKNNPKGSSSKGGTTHKMSSKGKPRSGQRKPQTKVVFKSKVPV